jgi:hypothetical protein
MLKRFVAGLVISLALMAAPASAASVDRDALGLAITHELLGVLPLNTVFDKAVEPMGDMFSKVSRPEWTPLFKDAAHEELAAQMPQIEAMFAQRIFASFTVEELEAGANLLHGPAGEPLKSAMATASTGQPMPKPSPAVQREFEKAMRNPAGRGFVEKLAKLDRDMGERFGRDIVPVVIPGMFRRFGEKAEAYERSRAAAVSH